MAELDTPAIAGMATVRITQLVVGGEATEGYAFDVRRGSGFLTLLAGRELEGDGEAVLGTRTLRRLGASIGDTIRIAGPAGRPATVRVVGRATLPVLNTDIDRAADGIVLSTADLAALAGDAADEGASASIVLRFADAASARRSLDAVARRLGQPSLAAPPEPRELTNMRPVRGLLAAIAVLTGLLAALSVVHLLLTGVRRRRGDLAVLRALGLSPGQTRSVVRWQALAIVVVAVGLGAPAGVIVGRATWSAVARQLGVAGGPVVPVLAMAAVAAGCLAGALVLAAPLGRHAATMRPAAALRAD